MEGVETGTVRVEAQTGALSPYMIPADRRAAMFELARSRWVETIQDPVVRSKLNNGKKKHVIGARRIGKQLATAYVFFDSRHAEPEPHMELHRTMGIYKDQKNLNEKGRKRELRGLLDAYDVDQLDFQPADNESYRAEVDRRIGSIVKAMEVHNLDPDAFHTVRKDLRHILHLYELLRDTEVAQSADVPLLINKMEAVNESMNGSLNKRLRAKNGVVMYKDADIAFRETDKSRIKEIFDMMGVGHE